MSPVSHKGLYQGQQQASIHLLLTLHTCPLTLTTTFLQHNEDILREEKKLSTKPQYIFSTIKIFHKTKKLFTKPQYFYSTIKIFHKDKIFLQNHNICTAQLRYFTQKNVFYKTTIFLQHILNVSLHKIYFIMPHTP